ncbi:DUF4411 family protein [Microbacterium sp. MEC084]|uniref:DUF4411 family protein n=1 Tax=Microbacterium sp. MEC084 TaxID=1963027 RepID=UPI00142FE4D7|nr:DUF4411 family protein [Microbacterium sp. MEC084]MCD1269891.1 DUF4411 family protein [Microbacterium sp. MEC084]
MTYLLDANVFIDAKNRYYGFDIAPGFWYWLQDAHEEHDIASTTAVRAELFRQEDQLTEWARTLPPSFWLEESAADLQALQRVTAWTMDPSSRFQQNARTDFLAAADYRLVSLALSGQHTIVTHEIKNPDRKNRIKIPDACAELGVDCHEPFDLFRHLKLRLVIG